ncbi:uncharacterized protein BO97DRAFT_413768 [Aspergillus homomorphus CBS 101889]|uniref:Uncharacterized protein n=1 Tax=Aspergillus homomorphus (strain CBS 101889) TaxID=1450537 RepID=A0A395I108_ASPHC|nr:hypothetical protein BO97DRAFT_413768 [Aspergillus homomorphus CBS 101889]RAL12838.1 hypothetical protein BO97DRAFT_413768 [Aspergillus homomorphus CBS 101889]
MEVTLLNFVPYAAINLATGAAERPLMALANLLERKGRWRQAQRLRRKQTYFKTPYGYHWKLMENLLKVDQRVLFYAMTHVLEQSQRKLASSVSDDKEKQKHKVDEYEEAVWYGEQERQSILASLMDGPLKRAYLLTHSQPGWHLSEWQRAQCAAKGGCCARACGCCARARCAVLAKSYYGHCLSTCVCCTKTRGFKVPLDEWFEDPMLIDIDIKDRRWNKRQYRYQVLNAYIWGL